MIINKEKSDVSRHVDDKQARPNVLRSMDATSSVVSESEQISNAISAWRCRNHLGIFEQSKLSHTVQKVLFFLLLVYSRSAHAKIQPTAPC